jgi:hypothetical protein
MFILAILTPSAGAEVIVKLGGAGKGTVTSSPSGINCSKLGGGSQGPSCHASFGEEGVELTASAGSGSVFSGWTGDDPFPGFFGPTCNEGSANPCATIDPTAFFLEQESTHITATFDCAPPIAAPEAVTGEAGAGVESWLRALEGEVNPKGCGLEESYFEYGTTTKYGSTTETEPGPADIGDGTALEAVTAETEPLEPETAYHYRLVAVGPGGVSKGEDRTFTTGSAPIGKCPNEARRQEQGIAALLLPDCMALEMVSPPQKGGKAVTGQAVSADGDRVQFLSVAALDDTPGGLGAGGDPYIATRGSSAWTTASTSPPVNIFSGQDGSAHALSYTPDLSRWFQIGSTRPEYEVGVGKVFAGGVGGIFDTVSPPLIPQGDGVEDVVKDSMFEGASTDHSHFYFAPGPRPVKSTGYLTGDPKPQGLAADHNTYVVHPNNAGQPALELLARDQSDKVWGGNCGARLGGIRPSSFSGGLLSEVTGERNQGAISSDGKRVYFSTRPTQSEAAAECDLANKLRILVRLESKTQGAHIEELFQSECHRSDCGAADGNDFFQGASADGSKVYFSTTRQLVDSDLDTGSNCSSQLGESAGCDLYLYDSDLPPDQRLTQVSVGEAGSPTPGEGANVLRGITAVSSDGSHVYFVAQGALTNNPGPKGGLPVVGQPNLYAWNRATETTRFIGSLNTSDIDLWGGITPIEKALLPVPMAGMGADGNPVAGDGHLLTFASKASMTSDDGDGNHRDVFRVNADTGELVRVSKAMAGGSDNGPVDVPQTAGESFATLGTDIAELARHTDQTGEKIVFSSSEGLVPGDVNGAEDGYLWQNGKLYRLPGRLASLPALSSLASTIAITTTSALLPQDGDTSEDVYAARIGGGYPQPETLEPCQPDASLSGRLCQGDLQSPSPPNVGSGNPHDAGNVQPRPSCRKGKVRRHGHCVKGKKRNSHKKNRTAKANRRAGK